VGADKPQAGPFSNIPAMNDGEFLPADSAAWHPRPGGASGGRVPVLVDGAETVGKASAIRSCPTSRSAPRLFYAKCVEPAPPEAPRLAPCAPSCSLLAVHACFEDARPGRHFFPPGPRPGLLQESVMPDTTELSLTH